MEAKILEATRKGPRDGTTHWSSYRLAKYLGVSHTTVYRVWRQFGIQPHRLRRYMASADPEFEEKAADIIGLYLQPPVHGAVFCVDEKSPIQALDRLDPGLPLSPGRAERQDSSTTGMAPSRFTLPWTPVPVKCLGKLALGIPAPSLSSSSTTSSPVSPYAARSTP